MKHIAAAALLATATMMTTACVSSGQLDQKIAPLQTQLNEMQSEQKAIKEQQAKTDAFITNDLRLGEAIEVGQRVDRIEKSVADLQRKIDEFQNTWDSALREHRSLVDNEMKTFERINSGRNQKTNQLVMTSIQRQIDAIDALKQQLVRLQSDLRIQAPETTETTPGTQ